MIEGHFLQMGGIVFYNNAFPIVLDLNQVLSGDIDQTYGPVLPGNNWNLDAMRRELKHLHKTVTVNEITDRSKSDALSKTDNSIWKPGLRLQTLGL